MLKKPVGRAIRSYVLRQGRLTEGQRRVLDTRWKDYGLELEAGVVDFREVFDRAAPVVLDIGFGNGAALAEAAEKQPEKDFIGVEVHRPGVGHLLIHLENRNLPNVRCYNEDVSLVLQQCIPDGSLSRVQVFFPDPWHKKRHHKRRLIQSGFITQLVSKLEDKGVIHLATDWENYAQQMLEVLNREPSLENLAKDGGFHPRPDDRPETKFELRGLSKGHGVWDLLFKKKGNE